MDFRANEMRKRNDPSLIISRRSGESIGLTTWVVNGHKPTYGVRIMKPVTEGYDVTAGGTAGREKKKGGKNYFIPQEPAVYLH